MPYTRTESFLVTGSVGVQQFIPHMAEWKKKTTYGIQHLYQVTD